MIGTTISHFKVTSKLGEGGMGEVYRATDTRLQREVAVKVLPKAMAADHDLMSRMQREAQLLAALSHPNIASILGLEEENGTHALVMELIEGEELAERLRRGKLSPVETAEIAVQMARALEAAHEKGIIHRDLKPANVKITPEGVVKVLDFGLAKAVEGDRIGNQNITQSPTMSLAATQAGIILGTAAYMSPEQAAGQVVDKRCDVWSFGVVIWEMLVGKRPFEGETLSHTMADVLRAQVDWDLLPEDTPPSLLKLLSRCLERNVSRRLRDMGEARILLEDYLADPEADVAAVANDAAVQEILAPAPASKLPWAVAAGLAVLLAGASFVALRPKPVETKQVARFQISFGEERLFVNRGASVVQSPAGDRLAWVVADPVKGALQVRGLADRVSREILTGTSTIPSSPFFSPDGQWLAFGYGNALQKIPFTGGSPQTLCAVDGFRGGAWGADGTVIFAQVSDGGLHRVADVGGQPQPLLVREGQLLRWPQFLPDGKRVLFISITTEGNSDFEAASIEVLDLETLETTLVHRGGYYARILDTGHLLYASNGTLFAAPLDLDSLQLTGPAVPVAETLAANPAGGSAQFDVSPAGHLTYVEGIASYPEFPIVRVERSGRETVLWDEVGTWAKPRFSPDGKRLAVTTLRDENWDIWVLDLERHVSTRLTFDEGIDSEHEWTPDGEWIIFSSDRSGADNLYRKRADGSGDVEHLSPDDSAQWANDVSPDGKWLIYQKQNASRDLMLLNLEEMAEPTEFLASSFEEDFSAFSPDGRWVAYTSNESGRPEVYVRPFPIRGGKWQISDSGGSQARWSNDGRELFYRSQDGVMVARVDGRGESLVADRPEQVFKGNYRGGLNGIFLGSLIFNDYDAAPDGQSFVLFPGDAGTDLGLDKAHVVMNWTDELKRLVPTKR